MPKTLSQEEKLAIIERHQSSREKILNILLELQFESIEGYIDQETARLVANKLKMTETRVYELLSFYSMLKTTEQARYVLKVCDSAPCHFTGAEKISIYLEKLLGVAPFEVTPDGLFAFHPIPCFGACDVAPVIKIKDQVFTNLTFEKIADLIEKLKNAELAL